MELLAPSTPSETTIIRYYPIVDFRKIRSCYPATFRFSPTSCFYSSPIQNPIDELLCRRDQRRHWTPCPISSPRPPPERTIPFLRYHGFSPTNVSSQSKLAPSSSSCPEPLYPRMVRTINIILVTHLVPQKKRETSHHTIFESFRRFL